MYEIKEAKKFGERENESSFDGSETHFLEK